MSLTIYRKYRPQKWADLTGQNHVKVTLQNEIATDNVAHAFLFTGPRGVGKTTVARLLAKSLNCENRKDKDSEPCNECDSCVELVGGQDLDILEIDAASHTGVDNVRENIIANARFTPTKRKYKVFIIDEVHMLSISAFNALLKILEEPPSHAIFILATTEIHKVPATIISRCQRFDFKKINADDLIKRLVGISQNEGVKIDKAVYGDIARVSEGCLRDAESLLGQILSLGEKEISQEEASLIIPSSNYDLVFKLIEFLSQKNIEAGINLVNDLVNDGADIMKFTDDFIEICRKIILSKINEGLKDYSFDIDEEMRQQIVAIAEKFKINDLIFLIDLFITKKAEIKTSALVQLPLEIGIIEFCQRGKACVIEPPGNNQSGGGASSQEDSTPVIKNPEPKAKEEIVESKSSVVNTTLKNENKVVSTDNNVTIKLSEIKDKWHEFIVEMQNHNASLVFILKTAEPLSVEGNVLRIGVRYEFHEQRLNQGVVKAVLESVILSFFKQALIISICLLEKNYKSDFIDNQIKNDDVELVDEIKDTGNDNGTQQELIDNLVKTFGGKVVE